MHVSVEHLMQLFGDDEEKLDVGMKMDMVNELVKMFYFDYTVTTEVRRYATRVFLE